MPTYTVTLTDAEDKALGLVAVSQQAWIDNAVHERCRIAMEEVFRAAINDMVTSGTPVDGPLTVDDVVLNSSARPLADIQAEVDASLNEAVSRTTIAPNELKGASNG